jgi:hypothetical protein
MNYKEQIAAFEQKRAALVAANMSIMEKAAEEGSTLDSDQQAKFDENEADIVAVDKHLANLHKMEQVSKSTAKPIEGNSEAEGSAARYGARVEVKTQPKLDKGIEFARFAKVKALSRLESTPPEMIAERLYGENSNVYGLIKATVAAGSTVTGNWAANLVGDETTAFADFVEFLRPATILGRFGAGGVPSLRSIPFRTALVSQTGGGAGYWVGEGKPKPLTAMDFARTTLEPLKVANIAVLTEEVIRDSSPSAEAIIRDSLRDALAERLDTDFIDPAKTAVSGVSPASITNGAEAIAATTYSDADDVRLDLRSVFQKFIAADNAPTNGVWVMSHTNALALSLITNGLGQPEFPGMGLMGGTLMGLPVIASQYVGSNVVLVNASDIYLGDEGGVMVDMSREASLEMLDGGFTQNAPTGASLVSMFQNNLVALRAERTINWSRRRTSAVAYLTGVAWGGAVNAS